MSTASDGAEAVSRTVRDRPDLVMIDLGMPQLDGMEVITTIRSWSTVPVLVISGRTGAAAKVEALDAGADDYMTKPFSIQEMLARIRALTRRAVRDGSDPVVVLGEVTVDLSAHQVSRTTAQGSRSVRLTPTEWRVLEHLVRNAGKLVTRQQLLTADLGAAARQGHGLPASLRGPAAQEARAGAGHAALHPHRGGDGLPAPAARHRYGLARRTRRGGWRRPARPDGRSPASRPARAGRWRRRASPR